MRRLRWSRQAREQYRDWLAYLAGIDPALASRAGRLVDLRARKIAERNTDGRVSRWSGLREVSIIDWHKLLVFQLTPTSATIVALYDMRQDLDAVSPKPE